MAVGAGKEREKAGGIVNDVASGGLGGDCFRRWRDLSGRGYFAEALEMQSWPREDP